MVKFADGKKAAAGKLPAPCTVALVIRFVFGIDFGDFLMLWLLMSLFTLT